MGFMCEHGRGECTGCMDCRTEPCFFCPVCGEEIEDTVFVDKDDDVIGCESCVKMKNPYEVFENEIN